LFRQVEQGFDRLFNYDRQQSESFDYHNTIKNSSISEQLKIQEQEFKANERKIEINQEIYSYLLFHQEPTLSSIPKNRLSNIKREKEKNADCNQ
jgi:hypothetical protein